jgi:hypothetical protein
MTSCFVDFEQMRLSAAGPRYGVARAETGHDQFRDTGDAECEATADSLASPGSHAHQGGVNVGQGLVNVQLPGPPLTSLCP